MLMHRRTYPWDVIEAWVEKTGLYRTQRSQRSSHRKCFTALRTQRRIKAVRDPFAGSGMFLTWTHWLARLYSQTTTYFVIPSYASRRGRSRSHPEPPPKIGLLMNRPLTILVSPGSQRIDQEEHIENFQK